MLHDYMDEDYGDYYDEEDDYGFENDKHIHYAIKKSKKTSNK